MSKQNVLYEILILGSPQSCGHMKADVLAMNIAKELADMVSGTPEKTVDNCICRTVTHSKTNDLIDIKYTSTCEAVNRVFNMPSPRKRRVVKVIDINEECFTLPVFDSWRYKNISQGNAFIIAIVDGRLNREIESQIYYDSKKKLIQIRKDEIMDDDAEYLALIIESILYPIPLDVVDHPQVDSKNVHYLKSIKNLFFKENAKDSAKAEKMPLIFVSKEMLKDFSLQDCIFSSKHKKPYFIISDAGDTEAAIRKKLAKEDGIKYHQINTLQASISLVIDISETLLGKDFYNDTTCFFKNNSYDPKRINSFVREEITSLEIYDENGFLREMYQTGDIDMSRHYHFHAPVNYAEGNIHFLAANHTNQREVDREVIVKLLQELQNSKNTASDAESAALEEVSSALNNNQDLSSVGKIIETIGGAVLALGDYTKSTIIPITDFVLKNRAALMKAVTDTQNLLT